MNGPNDFYEPGSWNVACAQCGRKLKSSQAVRNWMGQYRCPQHNEPRHPQDFVQAVVDNQTPEYIQPKIDIDLSPDCTFNGQSAIIGYGMIGCLIVGSIIVPNPGVQ